MPPRTCAFAIALDPIIEASEGLVVRAVPVRTPPLAKEDFAFVVDDGVPAGELVATVREAAGDLLEEAGCSTSMWGSRWVLGRSRSR